MTDVVRVPFVYGGYYYVGRADLESNKALLPIYTLKGKVWRDTPAGQRAMKHGAAGSLHRENIGRKLTEAESLALAESLFRAAGARHD